MRLRWIHFLIALALAAGADLGTKLWARHTLPVVPSGCAVPEDFIAHRCHGERVPIIDGFWDWDLAFNPSSAFGLVRSTETARWLLSAAAFLALIVIAVIVHKARHDRRLYFWGLGLIAGGALGNLVDRVQFGVVTDFVLWYVGEHKWPIFNVADAVLFVGVGLILLDGWVGAKKPAA